MKVIIAFCAAIAVCVAKPGHLIAPVVVAPVALAGAYSSQYHAQDELGQYNYGYTNQHSTKSEIKTADGITQGAYSYVDPEGKLQSVSYTSDSVNGFRVAASNLPEAPAAPAQDAPAAPMPVEDTPEVKAAKEQHFEAVKEAKALAEAAPEKVEVKAVVSPVVATYAAPVAAYAAPAAYLPTFAYSPYVYHPAVHGYSYSTYNYQPVAAYAAPYYAAPAFTLPHIPAVPLETPEVAKAKAEHLAAHEKARSL